MLKVTVLDKKDAVNCPFRDVIDRIGDKWTLLVLVVLEDGPARFTEIKRTIGDISQKVLTKTLQELEADGYLTRTAFDQSPPKVVYELTDMGCSVLTPITALVEWAEENHDDIRKNRSAYQRKRSKQT
ncbi:MAG: helix-turn-helix domain-containing protein [Candidatus Thiodiazotropha endolucinida]